MEPNTDLDLTGRWMWMGPDQAVAGSRVYFNGFQGTEVGYGFSAGIPLSPNVAALGSGIASYPQRPWALLGVWKDCNKDGYIGWGDQGLFEYRSELLLDRSLCQPSPAPLAHNDGEWVREFLPVGWGWLDTGGFLHKDDRYTIYDERSRVWADDGKPGEPGRASACLSLPPGSTMHTVGGILDRVDCAANTPMFGSDVTTIAEYLGASDTWRGIRASPDPWGEPGNAPDARVWDCGQPPIATFAPTDFTIYGIAPTVVGFPGRPNPAGDVSELTRGTEHCQNEFGDGLPHMASLAPQGPYLIENDHMAAQTVHRAQSDFTLVYADIHRQTQPIVGSIVGTTRQDGGIGLSNAQGYWYSPTVRGTDRNPYFDREGLSPETVRWTTYYASVSPTAQSAYALQLPSYSVGSYGAEACGTATTGEHNGWVCDPRLWWPGDSMPRASELGGDPHDPYRGLPIGASPGTPFNLRDVDCQDESVNGARDVGIGIGIWTSTACDIMPP